jgi:hypothetical protein
MGEGHSQEAQLPPLSKAFYNGNTSHLGALPTICGNSVDFESWVFRAQGL